MPHQLIPHPPTHRHTPPPRPAPHQPVSVTCGYRQCGIARRQIKTVGNEFELPRVSTKISARHRHACAIQREHTSLDSIQRHPVQRTRCNYAPSQTGSPWDAQHQLHAYSSCKILQASQSKEIITRSSHPASGTRSQCPTAVAVVVSGALVAPGE